MSRLYRQYLEAFSFGARVAVTVLGSFSVMPRGYILDDPNRADAEALSSDWSEIGRDYGGHANGRRTSGPQEHAA